MSCKLLLNACAGACVATLGARAIAQGTTDVYPSRPVRVVVGLAPGGGTDIQTRLIAQKLSENLGRSFVVENRTGAGGTVAYAFVAKSAPDGYTVLGVASGYSITPAVFHRLGYDPIRDFAPISLAIEAPILLLVHPALPAKNVKDLIALAKASPDALDFGSAGHGTSNH
ncbi:MAG: tripartite tricarboxylate transporter substrate-binding protein, partial [Burkholderiales bacterium]